MELLERAKAHGYRTIDEIVPLGYSEEDTFVNNVIGLHEAGYKYRISYSFDNMDDWEKENRPYIEAVQTLIDDHVALEPWTILHYPTGTYGRRTVTVLFFTNYKNFVYFKMMIV